MQHNEREPRRVAHHLIDQHPPVGQAHLRHGEDANSHADPAAASTASAHALRRHTGGQP